MFDVHLITNNVDLAQKLAETYGGTWRRVSRSVIYKEPDGAEYLCRYSCSSGISARHGKTFFNEQCVGIIFAIRRGERLFLGRDLETFDRTISYGEGELVA